MKVSDVGVARSAAVSLAALAAVAAGCGSGGGSDTSASQAAGTATTASATSCSPDTEIGMLVIAQVPLFDDMVTGFKEGYSEQTGVAVDDIRLNEQNAQGEPSNFQSLARQFASGPEEILGAIGTPVTLALQQSAPDKPIVTVSITDPIGPGLAKSLEEPGTNVTGSVDTPDTSQFVRDILAMDPDIKTIGTIYTNGNDAITPFNEGLDAAGAEHGVEIVKVAVANNNEVQSAARSLVNRVDAIVIGRDGAVAAGLPNVASVAEQAGTPLFLAYTGPGSLIPGVVGGYGSDATAVGRLAGEVAGKICEGAEPATTPYAVFQDFVWEFRRDTLEGMDLTVPAELEGRSKVVDGE